MSEIFLRVCVARGRVFRIRSGYAVRAERFRDGRIVKPKANQKEIAQLRRLENCLDDLENELLNRFVGVNASSITRQDVASVIELHHNPSAGDDEEENETLDFFSVFDEFIRVKDLSKNRADIYRSLARCLHRYEIHRSMTRDAGYRISIDSFSPDDLYDFQSFYRDEWKLYDEFPDIYVQYPAELRTHHRTHRPQQRGENIIINMMRKVRAFFNWCYQQGITDNRPFDRFDGMRQERYGTPFFLTLEERDRLADYDFSSRPMLAVQRDIFVFQCLIGCRVSDLKKLQKSNVVGGAVEYVAQKTKKHSADVVRVPLNAKARKILERYADNGESRLLPFISDQRYNDCIKEMLRLSGIDRIVTVINPKTGEDEQRPIHEVASSHMARRTFIGNIYKKVKDQLLVSSLTGHKEGSKAFSRYNVVDDEMKRDLVDLID